MITQVFFSLIMAIFIPIAHLLPDVSSLPGNINSSFTSFAAVLPMSNAFFPMDTVFQIIGIVLVTEGILMAFDIGMWVYHQFWGSK